MTKHGINTGCLLSNQRIMQHDPIFITGAGRRVGHYLAQQFHAHGYPVIAHYRSSTPEIEKLAALGITLVQGDFLCPTQVESLATQVTEGCTRLRAIIHNASCFYPTPRDSATTTVEALDDFYQVHMRAPALLNERLYPRLTQSAQADIVSITDIYAQRPNPAYDMYCASKAGLLNLTLSYAKRWAPKVKVNAIAPGPIWFLPEHSQAYREQVLAKTPLGIEGGPQPIFSAIKSLLDNPFITGTCLTVDGGRSLTE